MLEHPENLDPGESLRGAPPLSKPADRIARCARVLSEIEKTQGSEQQKAFVRAKASAALSDPIIGDALLVALEANIGRKESPVSPLVAVHVLRDGLVDLSAVTPVQIVVLSRIVTEENFKADSRFANALRPSLFRAVAAEPSGGAVAAVGALALVFREAISGPHGTKILSTIDVMSTELAAIDPSLEEARWFMGQATALRDALPTAAAIEELDLVLDGLGLALDRSSLRSRERHSKFFREELLYSPTETSTVIARMRAMTPLLVRDDLSSATIDGFRDLLRPRSLASFGGDPQGENSSNSTDQCEISFTDEVAYFIRTVTNGDPSNTAIDLSLSLASEVMQSSSGIPSTQIFLSLGAFAVFLRDLSAPEQAQARDVATKLYGTIGAESPKLPYVVQLLATACAQPGRIDLLELVGEALSVHQKASDAQFQAVTLSLQAMMHPGAPPDLVRTYQTAMSDSRFRNERASHALLKRLSMHAALYVLPESDSFSDIAQGLHPIAAGLQKHPHLFLQEEPDADHYRELQTAFYPRVRHVYEQERRNGRDRTTLRKPFHLLIPPLQRSLGAFIRVSDVHHGFGVHAIPSRRTPDGEAPLLVRFGLGHGDVSMLNTNDNMRFPGKGFALSKLEPELLFPARPVDFKPGEDPFALYKGAWPSLGRSIDHLRQAQFIFSRGMMVIAGVDPERYTITRHGARLQYSLVVFNAHFENPFNEVALLVPTELLRDFFKGLLSSANDYRGFNSQRPNALERIPNPRIFQRHPTLGRYVINVGLPESVMLGVTDSLSNEHHGWLKYRRDAMEYERRLRAVDRGFAARALGHGGHPSFFSPTNSRGAAQQLFNYTSADGAPELPRQNDLFSEEAQLIRERGGLIARFEQLDSLNDPLERNTWQCVNRLMELYDVFRVGFAYYTRGMTTPRSETPPEELERELGDADAAGFNPGGDLMLNELYRGHALHGFGGVNRERFPILLDADALFSSRFRHSSVMIDSFDMRGFVNDRPVQFSPGEITPEDIGAWQAGVLPHVRDTAGNIPELRLVERGMLPKLIVEKLDKRKGR